MCTKVNIYVFIRFNTWTQLLDLKFWASAKKLHCLPKPRIFFNKIKILKKLEVEERQIYAIGTTILTMINKTLHMKLRSGSISPNIIRWWNHMFLLQMWLLSCYSCYSPDDVMNGERTTGFPVITTKEHICSQLWIIL